MSACRELETEGSNPLQQVKDTNFVERKAGVGGKTTMKHIIQSKGAWNHWMTSFWSGLPNLDWLNLSSKLFMVVGTYCH